MARTSHSERKTQLAESMPHERTNSLTSFWRRKRGHRSLETNRQANDRPMLDQVKLEPVLSGALFVINAQGSIAQEAGKSEPVVDAHFKAVGGEHVPRELAADVEAADIAPQHQFL